MERDLHRLIRRELQDLGITPRSTSKSSARRSVDGVGGPCTCEAPLPKPGPSGMWVEYEDYDVILFQQETTRLHQDHIKLHEIGHILVAENEEAAARESAGETKAEAPAVDPDEETAVLVEGWATMLPVFQPETIKRVARRCSYEDGEECSVELVATIILEWSSVLDGSTPLSDDPSLRRVESALGDRRGWL
ncbi:hypothetical protein ACFQ0X_21985 [Streptomyces rectiviolaceus]|uniref:hypothetical protein n=1 Tax=Streptomyces rectiviolaceus TaxID=332591 RepID=UPI0036415696